MDCLPILPFLLPHWFANCLKVVFASHTYYICLPYVGHCWDGCPVPQYWNLCSVLCTFGAAWSHFCIFCLATSKSFVSFMSYRTDFHTLCTYTLCMHNNTCSPMVYSMTSQVAISLRISSIIPLSFSPLMNSYVSSLSYFCIDNPLL